MMFGHQKYDPNLFNCNSSNFLLFGKTLKNNECCLRTSTPAEFPRRQNFHFNDYEPLVLGLSLQNFFDATVPSTKAHSMFILYTRIKIICHHN